MTGGQPPPATTHMPATLTLRDETASGQTLHTFTLADLTERLTVRELLRARIWQEVQA